MSRRVSRSDAAMLATLQRVSRLEAESLLIDARSRADAADAEAARADTAEAHAEAAWQTLLAAPRFAPEWSRALAADLVQRQADAHAARETAREAAMLQDARREDWRAADARVRSADATLRTARRATERKREEKRLDTLADRIARDWRPA